MSFIASYNNPLSIALFITGKEEIEEKESGNIVRIVIFIVLF